MLRIVGFAAFVGSCVNADLAGFTTVVRAVAVALVLFWAVSPSAFAQVDPPPPLSGCEDEQLEPITGRGTLNDPYEVATVCQLQGIHLYLAAHYILMVDIVASPTRTWNNGGGFVPIALGTTDGGGFRGSFVNEDRHAITGLTINRPNRNYVGLFSRLEPDAKLNRVILKDARTTGRDFVGALVGISQGMILNSSVTASVVGHGVNVGGLVGRNRTVASIGNSRAAGSVEAVASAKKVGGLVGDNYGRISTSYATASVSGNDDVGGLVGSNNSSGRIIHSVATGPVSGEKNNIGGLVGGNEGSISYSYATSSVSGNDNVGGLVGFHAGSNSISNNYATGPVSGNNRVGGFVGDNFFGTSISNNYATGWVYGVDYVGGFAGQSQSANVISNSYYVRSLDNGFGYQRTFAQLRCSMPTSATCPLSSGVPVTYDGWDTNVWNFGSATDLPQLKSNDNPDLNLRPYIGGLGERVVRVGTPPSVTNLVLEADYPGTPRESVTLTWSLPELSPILSDFVYFTLADGTTTTTAPGLFSTLSVTANAASTSFYVVLKNNVSVNGDRVRVRVVEAQPPVIVGLEGNVLNRDVKESASTALLTFTANVGVPGDHSRLQWEFLVDGEPTTSVGDLVQFYGSTQGASVSVRLERPGGRGDFGSFVLRVTDPLGPSSTFTVNIVPVCAGNGEDLMTRQTGIGSASTPYRIWTVCQLQGIQLYLAAHYILMVDIVASPTRTWNNGGGFVPIALGSTDGGGFRGSFVNEDRHAITGLTINRPNRNYVGLFSRLEPDAKLNRVILKDARTTGRDFVGALVGISQGMILNSSVTASVVGYGDYVGGLVGRNRTVASIGNSRAAGSVEAVASAKKVGGLVGDNYGRISTSYATASVSGNEEVGGLVGSNNSSGRIIHSVATGPVSGEKNNIGGLVGGNEGSISYSYATSSVSGNDNVGGLVGFHAGSNSISNNYATGPVSGNKLVGGFVGNNLFGTSISNNYATGWVYGVDYVGGFAGQSQSTDVISNSYYVRSLDNGFGYQRTFAQLRCSMPASATCPLSSGVPVTYDGWDTNVWNFGSATDLPQLKSNDNPDLNLRPYIGGLGERVVRVGTPPSVTNLVLEADYPGTPRESVTLTWSLSGLPPALKGLAYFDSVNGMTATASGSSARLTIMPGAWGTEGTFFTWFS